jgi:hypothetical protein
VLDVVGDRLHAAFFEAIERAELGFVGDAHRRGLLR